MTKTCSPTDAVCVRRAFTALAFLVCFSTAALAADPITGVVRNQSKGRTAAGEDIVLLRLDQGMQEEAHTKTDDQGAFTFTPQSPNKLYLVRAVHQGVNYDQRATAGNKLAIDVFDAASKVQGIGGVIEIIRTGTKDSSLHVSDMIEIMNSSQPPLTQAGERTFEVFLPAKAKLDSVLASGAGKMAILISPSPVPGEPGHYTVNYPLRPGATQFAFNYDLPYTGRAVFHPRLAYPMQQLAVMLPPSMNFKSDSPAFHALSVGGNDYKAQAANMVKAGEAPGFEISGAGAIPALPGRQPRSTAQVAPNQGAATQPPVQPPPDNFVRPAPATQGGQQAAAPAPVAPAAAVSPREWWILGGTAFVVLGTCGFLIWRTSRRSRAETETAPAAGKKPVAGSRTAPQLETLKQKLMDLETSRLEGSISAEEYDKAKQDLQGNLQRALSSAAAKS